VGHGVEEERPFPVELLTGQELDGTRLEVELTFPTRIKQALTQTRVGFPVPINDRDAEVVQGRTAAGTLVTLYFDSGDGTSDAIDALLGLAGRAHSHAVRLRGLSPGRRCPDAVQVDANMAGRTFGVSIDGRAAERQYSCRSICRASAASLIAAAILRRRRRESQVAQALEEFMASRIGIVVLIVGLAFAVPVFATTGRRPSTSGSP
jgi:hypothetical protein